MAGNGAKALVRRDPKTGRLLPGSKLNPNGHLANEMALRKRLRDLAGKILEENQKGGKSLFETTVRALLRPMISTEKGPKYLVNDRTVLATLEFLTERAAGKPWEPEEAEPGKGFFAGMTVIIRCPRPHRPAAIDTTAKKG